MKFLCRCGNPINDHTFPNPIGLSIISDEALDNLGDQTNAAAVMAASSTAFRCANCGRLWIIWSNSGEGILEEFAPIDAAGNIRGG